MLELPGWLWFLLGFVIGAYLMLWLRLWFEKRWLLEREEITITTIAGGSQKAVLLPKQRLGGKGPDQD